MNERVGRIAFGPAGTGTKDLDRAIAAARPGGRNLIATDRLSLAHRSRLLARELNAAGFVITAGHLVEVAEALEKPDAPDTTTKETS